MTPTERGAEMLGHPRLRRRTFSGGTMAATTTTRPTFTDDELAQLIELIKDSDSVELKLTVPESHQRSTVSAFGMDPLQAQIRQVFFFDTPELTLNKEGVVVRARRIQGKGGDSV